MFRSPSIPSAGRGGGGVLDTMRGRSRMTADHRIPTMPGGSTSGFHRPGIQWLHQAGGGVLDRRDVLDIMYGRSRMTVGPRIPTMRDGARRVFIDQAGIARGGGGGAHSKGISRPFQRYPSPGSFFILSHLLSSR